MNQKNLDTEETITKMRKELDFGTFKDEIIQIFDENREIVLATSSKDRVTARTVTYANDELEILFWSWDSNKKIAQIKENPKVALTLKNVQYEGEAEILGKPLDKKNKVFLNLFERKLSKAFVDTFSKIPEMVLVKICPKTLVKFETINSRFYFQKMDIKNRRVFQMRIEDKNNPAFPY